MCVSERERREEGRNGEKRTVTMSYLYKCKHLTCSCQEQVEGNVMELVGKMLEAEKDEWDGVQPPEQDANGAYYTTVGITLFQMVEQNVSNEVYT